MSANFQMYFLKMKFSLYKKNALKSGENQGNICRSSTSRKLKMYYSRKKYVLVSFEGENGAFIIIGI